ncbi:cytochrome c oxidase assembly protein [Streptomyces sp. A7024]|uniref:Cytochrome c oxidase assembly protein n=1 Tax=Streptomyces coryli TaxID=1128680 RepID=A0A6G4UAB8_9ACTN|nr:cytochrome c oxidase assembly protein [Streptomyces coryli]NGN68660.1 cytochrome c oxidase assembly protein [Streptomyces coryli]
MDHGGHGGHLNLPPFTLERGLAWSPDTFFLIACALGLALYAWGVIRLIRRGDKWPIPRTIAFTVGVLTVALVMCTGLNDYGMVMFSVHMVQHMIISMLSPILILLGAPVTLLLRALPTTPRGKRGPRSLLVSLLHSRYLSIITHPVFTIILFIASLYALYFTPIFDTLMGSRVGHIAMMCHFLAVGLVFFWPIMGVDPGPHQPTHVMRILTLFAGMPFHAFFGIALMMGGEPMVATFADPPASLHLDPLGDQQAAGGIAWAFSEIPSILVLVALIHQWYHSEQRKARRDDRAAARDGDAELVAYNAYLASLNSRSS